MTMPVDRKCEVFICYLDDYFSKRVCRLDAAEAFCRRHKSERPSYELKGVYDEDYKEDWENYK